MTDDKPLKTPPLQVGDAVLPTLPGEDVLFSSRRVESQGSEYATHDIDNVRLQVVLDKAHEGTWTASWWYPVPMVPKPPEWADGSGSGYPTREAAEAAAIEWARAHGPQR